MGWDGSGGYTRQRNFSADASAGIKILASAMDQEVDDIASAFTNCLTRDGQNSPTGNITLGGTHFTNVGAATAVNQYLRVREFIENVPIFMLDTTTSTDTVSVSADFFTSVSAAQAPLDGTKIMVRVASDKDEPVMRFSGHSANIHFAGGGRIDGLVSGAVHELTYSSADGIWETGEQRLIPRTDAEDTAGVTPTNYQYEPGNILRYGAVADGSTNNATAIQNAVDQAQQTNGAPVYFPAGDDPNGSAFYKIGTGISVTAPILIYGDAYWRSVISCTADITAFSFTNAASRSVIRDISIFGNAGASSTLPGVLLTNCQKCVFDRVYISRFNWGVSLATGASGSYLNTFRDCAILFNNLIDILANGNSNALIVDNCQFGQTTPTGIQFIDSNSLVVIGGDFEGCTSSCIDIISFSGVLPVGASISGVHFEQNESSFGDIKLRGATGADGVKGVIVSGCLFSPTGTNYSPLTAADLSDGIVFSGNTVVTGYTNVQPDIASTVTNYVQFGNSPLASIPNQVGNQNFTGITRHSGTPQTLTGAGAVNLTTAVTLLVTTGADALTLADGSSGQDKWIVMKTDGGAGTLTPTSLYNGTTITFDDVGDSAYLKFIDGQWVFMGGTATLA